MADLSITSTNVLPTSTTEYVDQGGIAGVAISAGELLYKHSDGTYKLSECDVALGAAAANLAGMAMNTAVAGGPVVVAKGLITIGSGFTVGMQINLSATAGKAAPVADIATTNNVVVAGCIMSGTTIFIFPKNFGVLHV